MREYDYRVQLPMPGGGWYDVCTCGTAEYLAAVVQALAAADIEPPPAIQVLVIPRMERKV